MNHPKAYLLGLLLAPLIAATAAVPVLAQDSQSVADAARRAREEKKNAPKTATVITNDTLKPSDPSASASPAAAPTPSQDASSAQSAAPSSGASSASPSAEPAPKKEVAPEDLEKKKAEDTAARAELEEAKRAVDLAQRELSLASDDFYTHPDFSKDEAGKARIEELKQALSLKQEDLDKVRAKLKELGVSDSAPSDQPKP